MEVAAEFSLNNITIHSKKKKLTSGRSSSISPVQQKDVTENRGCVSTVFKIILIKYSTTVMIRKKNELVCSMNRTTVTSGYSKTRNGKPYNCQPYSVQFKPTGRESYGN